jgi:hypothetical protein
MSQPRLVASPSSDYYDGSSPSSSASSSCLTPMWDKACRSMSPFSLADDTTVATEDLSETSSDDYSIDEVSRELILKLVGDILQEKRRLVVQRSLELLSKLCFHHAHAEQHRVFLLQAGGAVAIVHALRRFEHVALQTAAIQALMNLSQLYSSRSVITSAGGIPLLLGALRRHKKTSFLHLCGCGVLAELSCDRRASECILKERGAAQIVASMVAFPQNKRLQHSACLALYRLAAVGMPLGQVKVEGSIEALTQALVTHQDTPLVTQYAQLALVALLPGSSTPPAVAARTPTVPK